jgi:hypothetical protein
VLTLKKAASYRITATKQGYKTWKETRVLTNESRIEMILEKTEDRIQFSISEK